MRMISWPSFSIKKEFHYFISPEHSSTTQLSHLRTFLCIRSALGLYKLPHRPYSTILKMGDPSSSSNSRSANVAKFLIVLNEYQKLLALKQHCETQESKLKRSRCCLRCCLHFIRGFFRLFFLHICFVLFFSISNNF